MPSSIFAKYSPEMIFGENTPVAITDGSLKITWFNRAFKNYFAIPRLKGKSLTSLLKSVEIEKEFDSTLKKSTSVKITQINS